LYTAYLIWGTFRFNKIWLIKKKRKEDINMD